MCTLMVICTCTYYFCLDQYGFKPVKSSQDPRLQFAPTNLHIQQLHVVSSTASEQNKNTTYGFVTMASPTYNRRTQGLRSMLESLPCCPSFISQSSNTSSAGLVTAELSKLQCTTFIFSGSKIVLARFHN